MFWKWLENSDVGSTHPSFRGAGVARVLATIDKNLITKLP
jgi:hypothetical protein